VPRTPSVLVFPSDDETLLRLVRELVRDSSIRSPANLEEVLRPLHPGLVVRGREISAEALETWYVYRDGSFTPRGRHTPWWNSADAAWVVYDQTGAVLDANAAFVALMGVPDTAGLRGRSYLDFVVPDAAMPAELLFRMALRGEAIESRARIVRLDGSHLDIEHRTWLTPDGVRSSIRPVAFDEPSGS
jgi:PAS domain S-box-containing protein